MSEEAWSRYEARMEAVGRTKREHNLYQTKKFMQRKAQESLSYHEVLIDGEPQNVMIIKQSDLNDKKICAMPGDELKHGGYVDYADSVWLITELSAESEVYMKGIMRRCNHVLRWLNHKGEIIEKWCVVEDGTKYLIGENQQDVMTVGDGRMAVTIAKDDDTVELRRGNRFLIDDSDSEQISAYQITKSNRLYNLYNDEGVFRFIVRECNTTDDDNFELRIADYYNWKPGNVLGAEHEDQDMELEEIVENGNNPEDLTAKGVWL